MTTRVNTDCDAMGYSREIDDLSAVCGLLTGL